MRCFKVAVAQTASVKGDVQANIETHLQVVKAAAEKGVLYLVFPELSLTGYEPELAKELAITRDDQRLAPLIEAASTHNIHIGVGAPVQQDGLIFIGLFVVSPTGNIEIYYKIHLHPGEDKYFAPGQKHHLFELSGQRIANAICADTNHPDHVQRCSELGADVYMAGVLITPEGYQEDTEALRLYSQEFNLLVAMANHSQPTGGWLPAGKSAIWFDGELLACANENQNALVVAERLAPGQSWRGEVIELGLS